MPTIRASVSPALSTGPALARWPRSPRFRRAVVIGWLGLLGWGVASDLLPALHGLMDVRPLIVDEARRMDHELSDAPMGGGAFRRAHPEGSFLPPTAQDMFWLNEEGPYRSMLGATLALTASTLVSADGIQQPASAARDTTLAAWQAYGETAFQQAQLDHDRSLDIDRSMDRAVRAYRRFFLHLMPATDGLVSERTASMVRNLARGRYDLWHPQATAAWRARTSAWIAQGGRGTPPARSWDGLSTTEQARWADPAFHPAASALR